MSSSLLTIVDDYILAAIRHAEFWRDDEGFVVAHVEGYPGIRAHGTDLRSCRLALARQVGEWVELWLRQGTSFPSSTAST